MYKHYARLTSFFVHMDHHWLILLSDVPARAWPESRGFGLALDGPGLTESQARPWCRAQAWLGPGLGLGRGLSAKTTSHDYLLYLLYYYTWQCLVCTRGVLGLARNWRGRCQ